MLSFALSASLVCVFTVFVFHDTRTPVDTRLLYKYRIKDGSILRRIIPFRDKPHYPCSYFKVVPIYIYLFVALLGWLLFIIDVLGKGAVTEYLTDDFGLLLTMAVCFAYFLYFVIITIWWGVIDHKLMRFTDEEKAELKRLRKSRKK